MKSLIQVIQSRVLLSLSSHEFANSVCLKLELVTLD